MSDLKTLISDWDGLGVVTRYDRETGTWIFVALHDATLGRPTGGTRMRVYDSPEEGLRDALRLAEGMTHKWAAAGGAFGGGKAVLAIPRPLTNEERTGLLRRYGRLLESLDGAYATAPDMNIGPAEIAVIAQETEYVHCFDRATQQPVDPGPYTALGVFVCIRAVARQALGADLQGCRVLVQGVGDVGAPLVRMLHRAGARLMVCDVSAERAQAVAAEVGGEVVLPHTLYEMACDIYAPCAVGATLNRDTVPQLKCRAVAGAANNQLAVPEDAERLHQRKILYAPDYIVNAGGAMGIATLEATGSDARARERVERIADTLVEILVEAKERDESPVHSARRRVGRVLAAGRV